MFYSLQAVKKPAAAPAKAQPVKKIEESSESSSEDEEDDDDDNVSSLFEPLVNV